MFNPTSIVTLGKTSVKVTRLGLGTGYLGGLNGPISEAHFFATVDQAHALGVRYFDTAPLYGLGMSEQRLGAYLSQFPRDSYVLSTKTGRLIRPPDFMDPAAEIDHLYDSAWHGVPQNKLVIDYSYEGTMRSIEESLKRLGVGRIDIAYIHDAYTDEQYQAAVSGAYRALAQLRTERVIGAVGVGIGLVNRLIDFARAGDFDCFLVAGRYTLLDQSALAELLPICEKQDISVVLGSVYNSGLLADPYRPNVQFDYEPAIRDMILRARQMDNIAHDHGIPLKAAALQFPQAHPAVATVMTGATSPEEAIENVQLVQLRIPPAFWSDLKTAGLLPETAPTPLAD